MEPVGQFDYEDSYILGHCQEHFPEIFSLYFFF